MHWRPPIFLPSVLSSDGPARHHGSDGDDQPGGQADPTDGAIVFDVVFSEPVFGFAAGDVLLSGTAGATTATVSGSGTTYTVTVTGMTGDIGHDGRDARGLQTFAPRLRVGPDELLRFGCVRESPEAAPQLSANAGPTWQFNATTAVQMLSLTPQKVQEIQMFRISGRPWLLCFSMCLAGLIMAPAPAVAQPLKPISVIVFPGGFNWPIWVAQEKGLFDRNGIAVTVTPTPDSKFQLTNLIDGKFDIAMTAIDNVIAYMEGQGAAPPAKHRKFLRSWVPITVFSVSSPSRR